MWKRILAVYAVFCLIFCVTMNAFSETTSADNTNTSVDFDQDLNIASGKTLELGANVDVTVPSDKSLTVNGTLDMSQNLVNHGSVTVDGTAILKEGLSNESDGTFTLTGGEILSDSPSGTIQNAFDGTLNLTGGTITNTGSGPAISVTSGVADWEPNAVIRSHSPIPVDDNGSLYNSSEYEAVSSEDGYYYYQKRTN